MFTISILIFSAVILISCVFLRITFTRICKWTHLYDHLHNLFIKGFGTSAPFMYFLSIIVFCGGIGIWGSFYLKVFDVSNITTYVFALLSSLMVDLIIVNNDDRFTDKEFMMYIISSFLFTLVIAALAPIINNKYYELKWFMGFVSIVCTWYLWWILSSSDRKFGLSQKTIRRSTIGGEPTDELQGGGLEALGDNIHVN